MTYVSRIEGFKFFGGSKYVAAPGRKSSEPQRIIQKENYWVTVKVVSIPASKCPSM